MGCGGCRKGITVQVDTAESLKAPVLKPDGSIQFPKDQEVPNIEGYKVSSSDDHRLIPDEACACIWKITGIMLQKNGGYKPHHVCRHSKCEYRSKEVNFDICKACPLREEEPSLQ